MKNQASVLIDGNLIADPIIKKTTTGKTVCTFAIVVNHTIATKDNREEGKDHVSFFDIETWGKLAEFCGSLKKGKEVFVVGELRQDRWKAPDGTSKNKIKVIASRVNPGSRNGQQEEGYEVDIKQQQAA
jgi:single-strand DNA-binding protein